jgi:hypothetical protein
MFVMSSSAAEAKIGGSKGTRRKPDAHRQTFLSFFKLSQIGRRMSQPTEGNVSCHNLSALATYEHVNAALSSTCHLSIGGGEKPREPDRSNLDTPSRGL